MKFILSRVDDRDNHSTKWIVGYALLFWLVSRIVAVALNMGCVGVYSCFDINPAELTKFAGSPEVAKSIGSLWFVLMAVTVVAPLLEELLFRLGLSFRRWHVALSAGIIPIFYLWSHNSDVTLMEAVVAVVISAAVFVAIYKFTTDELWQRLKRRWLIAAMWISSLAFGLIHLVAFSHFSIELLPYMMCVVSVPFFAGCACAYLRVNLGFWWGVGMHVFNNLPAIAMIL